jgi:hypothetical protein
MSFLRASSPEYTRLGMEIIENLPFPSRKRASRERPLEAASATNYILDEKSGIRG